MNFFARIQDGPVAELQAADLNQKLSSGNKPYLLDVREPLDFRAGHIAGAKLKPLGELNKRLHEIPKGVEVVCICASGHRSLPAVRRLASAGYTATPGLKNGMIAWQMARLSVVKGMSRSAIVRQEDR